MNKNKVFEVAKTIVNGIKTFRSYGEEFGIDDYGIIVRPASNKFDDGYEIIITDWSINEIVTIIPVWNSRHLKPEQISNEIWNAIKD